MRARRGACIAPCHCEAVHRSDEGSVVLVGTGMFVVTAALNIPLNDALAAVDPSVSEGAALWTNDDLRDWTFWNHVGTLAPLAAAVVLSRPSLPGNLNNWFQLSIKLYRLP